jgi:hypothetical protein
VNGNVNAGSGGAGSWVYRRESVCARRRAGKGCGVATRLGGSTVRRDVAFVSASASAAVLLLLPLLVLLLLEDMRNSALASGGEGCRSVEFFLCFEERCFGCVSGSVAASAGGDEGRLEGGDGCRRVDVFRWRSVSASRLRWWPVACTGGVDDRVDDADVGVDADVGEVCCRGVFFPRGALCGGGEGMRSTGAISRWRGVA